MACEDCQEELRNAQLLGAAIGILVGAGLIFALYRFGVLDRDRD